MREGVKQSVLSVCQSVCPVTGLNDLEVIGGPLVSSTIEIRFIVLLMIMSKDWTPEWPICHYSLVCYIYTCIDHAYDGQEPPARCYMSPPCH